MMETMASYVEKAMEQVGEREWQAVQDAQDPVTLPRKSLATLDTSNTRVKTAVQAARAWAQRKRDGFPEASLVLSGPVGTGKTHIAQAILWSITDEPEGLPLLAVPAGKFWLANDLLLRLAPTQDPETGIIMTPRAGNLVGSAPLVVIDDVGGQQDIPYIGRERQEQEMHARWFSFINHCYTLRISVIMTTNLSLAGGHECELARHLGARAWDRLCEMAPAGFMISLDGVPSWRVKSGGR
jgi:DNA replication protein DnaC